MQAGIHDITSLSRQAFYALKVSDVMTHKVYTVPSDWPVNRLAVFLDDKGISGAPVVNESGILCGVVSATDLVRQAGSGLLDLAGRNDSLYEGMVDSVLSQEEQRAFHENVDQTVLVADVMTPVVYEVSPDTSLQEVAEIMVTGHLHRVLVSDNGRLKGIVTAIDVLGVAVR